VPRAGPAASESIGVGMSVGPGRPPVLAGARPGIGRIVVEGSAGDRLGVVGNGARAGPGHVDGRGRRAFLRRGFRRDLRLVARRDGLTAALRPPARRARRDVVPERCPSRRRAGRGPRCRRVLMPPPHQDDRRRRPDTTGARRIGDGRTHGSRPLARLSGRRLMPKRGTVRRLSDVSPPTIGHLAESAPGCRFRPGRAHDAKDSCPRRR
jgi:hypothetical protein